MPTANLSSAQFDALLDWLNPDRERAGEKYESIRNKLIVLFERRGCRDAEDLADRTIDRVARMINDAAHSYEGDPASLFYRVARFIYLEYQHSRRKESAHLLPETLLSSHMNDGDVLRKVRHDCLERCLEKLTTEERELVLSYYQGARWEKLKAQMQLAAPPAFSGHALRALGIRAAKLRSFLRGCINECMAREAETRGGWRKDSK